MEQKKVQRIIGILVVISIVIIVMPLLFGKNFPVQEAANIKAPPFPDQQDTHLASAAPTATIETNQEAIAAAPAPTPTRSVLPTPPILSPQSETPVANATSATTVPSSSENQATSAMPVSAKKVSTTPSEKPAPAVGTVIYEPVAAPASTPVAAINPTASTAEAPVIITETSVKKAEVAVAKPVPQAIPEPIIVKSRVMHVKVLPQHAKAKIVPLHKSGSPAWAVQVGNFAIKKNAIHLTNVLNAAGYKAFTHDVKTTNGKTNTRVYIGPQSKQAAATQLTTEINQKLNLQAFVVSYKTIKV